MKKKYCTQVKTPQASSKDQTKHPQLTQEQKIFASLMLKTTLENL